MTSRAKNWAVLAAVGAIFSLVVLIVYIWTGYKSSPSSSSASTARDPLQEPKGLTTGELDVSTLFPSTGIGPDTSTSESTPTTQTPGRRQLSIGEVLGDDQLMEEVRPIKLPPPLEEEALEPEGEEPPPRLRHERHHHTGGHFRARSPGLWDPHPRYAFSAFGRRFRLDLALDARFLSPHLRVTTIWQGSEHGAMIREKKPAVEDHGSCFYSGTVYGDPSSSVAVNLCHGMTGHIRTAEGSFFIEPIQEWLPQSPTTLHAIYRVSGSPPPPPSFPAPTEAPSSCGLDESMHKPKINHNKLLAPVGLPDHSSRSTEVHDEEEDDYDDEDEEEDDEEDEDEDEDEEGGEKESKKKKGENTTIEGGERERRRRKKRSVSMEYFVEVMVVADRKMIDYHGSGLVSYVLTLMSIVSLIYKDASIGNPMTVAVVKLVQLNEDFTTNPQRRRDSSEGTSAPDMLKNFCDWQSKINHQDDSSPAHHDTALLLTRENICRNPMLNKCDTLGLAELGTMCEEYTSCAIVQDNGLSAAFTIAHELGHVLNMPHDDDIRCKHFLGGTRVHNVMSRMLDHNTHPWSWSNCSRHFMTEFLEAGRGRCLLDPPPASTTNETKEEKLPGESFTEDRQCEFVFGTGSKICSYMPVCSRLWCTTALGEEQEGCRTQHMPWADGTSCGGGMWCQKGKCVAQNRSALLPVDGGWSQWQRWGPCSRTCGGGIKKSERACASPPPANGGKYCIGERVRIRSCRKTECPAGSRDFREVQCAQFNNNNFSIQGLPSDVKWVPKYDGISPSERCKLYCRVSHTNAYYRLGDKVKDGTTCGPNTYDMCVNGLCHSADCSHTINPVKHQDVDICGKCGGDNSTCKMIGGEYNVSSYGYRRVIPIPAGSSNLDIRQSGHRGTSKDDNYLALVNPETGDYLLNGNFIVSTFRKLIVYGGTTIEYSGSSAAVERINSSRPLSKDLILEVLSVGKLYPPNIYYQYTVLSKPEYRWEMKLEWTRCNSMCQGEQVRKPACIRVSSGTGEIVPDHFCIHLTRPRSYVQVCNTHCILRWKVSHESPCSARTCTKNRTVQCVREDPSRNGGMSQVRVLEERVCQHISSKPHLQIPCQRPCHGTWQYSAWSPCSASCGEGVEKRKYICMGSDGQELVSKFCKGGKHHGGEERRKCKIQDCPRWATGEWTPCSVTCGSGEQQRPYWCELEGKAVAEAYCRSRVGHHESIPIHVQQCKASPCPYHSDRDNWIQEEGIVPTAHPSSSSSPLVSPTTALALPRTPPPPPSSSRWHYNPEHKDGYLPSLPVSRHGPSFRWRAGLWGPCSETCKEEGGKSNGYLRRLVACQDEHGRDADDSFCPLTERPLDVTPCQLLPICPRWMHGEWGPCNVSCGEGRQFREVGCRGSEGQALAETKCSPIKRPSSVRVCAVVSCPSWPPQKPRQREPKFVWKAWHWEKCSTTCGPGFQRRRVSCHRVNRAGSGDPEHLEPLPAGPGPPHYCQPSLKPAEHQHCHIAECGPQYRWKTGRWKPCSEPCGKKGKQRRVVSCIKFKADGQTKRVPKHHCPQSQKPQARQKCNRHSCDFSTCEIIRESKWRQHGSNVNLRDGEYHLLIGGINMSIYCHGMGTRTNSPKEYLTLPAGETENFSEFYDRRLLNPNTCPDGGVRRDDCDCTIDSNGKGGLTVFSRVRINVTSLRIDTSDMTFTRQKQGSRVAYGKAGDCYSSLDCPQGRFSINLKGTKLRVHDDVKWEGSGASAAVHIERREDGQAVIGRCGGYCGACQPAGAPWISLEIMPPRNEGGLR